MKRGVMQYENSLSQIVSLWDVRPLMNFMALQTALNSVSSAVLYLTSVQWRYLSLNSLILADRIGSDSTDWSKEPGSNEGASETNFMI